MKSKICIAATAAVFNLVLSAGALAQSAQLPAAPSLTADEQTATCLFDSQISETPVSGAYTVGSDGLSVSLCTEVTDHAASDARTSGQGSTASPLIRWFRAHCTWHASWCQF